MEKAGRVKRRKVEVFTLGNGQYRVKADVTLNDFKQALSLRAIISAFETSVQRTNDGRKNLG